MSELIVTANIGKTVNLRMSPSTSSAIVQAVPVKQKVQLIEKTNTEWYKVQYKSLKGYMMAKYLKSADSTISQEDLREVYNSLKETLVLIEKIL